MGTPFFLFDLFFLIIFDCKLLFFFFLHIFFSWICTIVFFQVFSCLIYYNNIQFVWKFVVWLIYVRGYIIDYVWILLFIIKLSSHCFFLFLCFYYIIYILFFLILFFFSYY